MCQAIGWGRMTRNTPPVEHSYLPLSAFWAVFTAMVAGEARQKSAAARATEALETNMVGLGGVFGFCVLGEREARAWCERRCLVDDGVGI
jgi:hypothetical protein